MSERYSPGELFAYVNGDRWELGMVKAPNNSGDGYFCWYSRGDTAANTPTSCMHKLTNAGFTHIEQLLDAATVGAGTLTAEQVRECVKGVYFEGYGDGATHRVNGIEKTDWQTIADKLNATLGAGTCNIEKTHGKSPIDGKEIVIYKCSECGTLIGADSRYCNQCGARVVSEYYLCDTCHLKIKDFGTDVLCQHTWPCAPKKVMHDHHGKGGRRYDEPTQVCEHYEPKGK